MKTEDYLILGVAGFLAYKMVQKDVNTAIESITPQMPSFPNIDFSDFFSGFEMPAINFTPAITAGTTTASFLNPATQQPSILNPGNPDPYTKAPVELITGMPKGAQWANAWGEGYAYDFKTTAQNENPRLSTMPTVGLGQPPSVIDFAKPPSGSFAFVNVLSNKAPVMSYATQQTSDLGMSGGSRPFVRTAEQQTYVNARTHLGAPIGTPAYTAAKYSPNTVYTTGTGDVKLSDANGNIIHDSSAIINQSDRLADIAKYKR